MNIELKLQTDFCTCSGCGERKKEGFLLTVFLIASAITVRLCFACFSELRDLAMMATTDHAAS